MATADNKMDGPGVGTAIRGRFKVGLRFLGLDKRISFNNTLSV